MGWLSRKPKPVAPAMPPAQRKAAARTGVPRPPAATPELRATRASESPPGAAAPKAPGQSVSEGTSARPVMVAKLEADLPAYGRILSGTGGAVRKLLRPEEIDHVVIVDSLTYAGTQGMTPCQIFCTPQYATKATGLPDLKARLRRAKFEVYPEAPTRVTKELVGSLYQSDESRLASGITQDNTEMEALFLEIASEAVTESATDIHFEIRQSQCEVKLRVFKQLEPHRTLPGDQANLLLSAIYASLAFKGSRSDSQFRRDTRQYCALQMPVNGKIFRFRYQHAPANPDGVDAVLRLLPIGTKEEEKILSFEQLGYTPGMARDIEEMFAKPEGVVAIAGTTGSGKSTTLKHAISGLIQANPTKKVRTIEDPPEYVIHGASQMPIARSDKDEGSGANPEFEAAIKACMRMDPDFIMIGEVRDVASAALLTRAVQSGHQVATSVHADSGVGIVGRLANLGIPRDILAGPNFLTGLIYQKLLPTLCPKCKVPHREYRSDNIKKVAIHRRVQREFGADSRIGNWIDRIFYRGPGCDHCKGRGLTGMTVAAEVIRPDSKFLNFVLHCRDIEAQDYWQGLREQGDESGIGMSCLEHGLLKMRDSLVSPEDIEAAYGFLTPHTLSVVHRTIKTDNQAGVA